MPNRENHLIKSHLKRTKIVKQDIYWSLFQPQKSKIYLYITFLKKYRIFVSDSRQKDKYSYPITKNR
jgi:hypothetical protein